jgi:biopolymer transport protein ExbD
MRLPAAPRRPLEFNITPLIDVVFLLNIFFLVASYYVRHEQVDPVELPTASAGEDDVESSARVIVTVDAGGNLWMAGEPVTTDGAVARVLAVHQEHPEGAEFRLRCDRRAEYVAVEPLLLGAVKGGVTKVRFSVLPE